MTTDELLARMASLLHMDDMWHARATGGRLFHEAATPREAMLAALGISEEPVDLNADLF